MQQRCKLLCIAAKKRRELIPNLVFDPFKKWAGQKKEEVEKGRGKKKGVKKNPIFFPPSTHTPRTYDVNHVYVQKGRSSFREAEIHTKEK